MVRVSRDRTGMVWVNVNGSWKCGEHVLQRKASKWVVVSGGFTGLVFGTLCDGQKTIRELEMNAKALRRELAAEEHGEDWEGFGEWIAEKQHRERDGYEMAMDEIYEKLFEKLSGDSQDPGMSAE